jgi:hypothetical protein
MNKRLFITLTLLFVSAIPWKSSTTQAQVCVPLAETTVVPCASGVNIDFTESRPGELELLKAAGFRWVRMDLKWDVTEIERGKYDFGPYERLLTSLDSVGVKALFILDYGNPLYDDGAPPRSPETRQAFTNWALAAAKKFRGRGIIWELYNEPNHDLFWPPRPNADEYATLALMVGKAFAAEVPNEILIGPALSEIDLSFLETCFKRGTLKYWSAISVHPYKREDPESVASDYEALRRLIEKYAPVEKRQMPIISSEWGYSTAWPGISDARQSELLTRVWLTNLAHGVRLSIWYDWRDDGTDKQNAEHNFGTVSQNFRLKPAYLAARTFNQFFAGHSFERRVKLADERDYLFVFRKGSELRWAAWTMDQAHATLIKLDPGSYERVDHLGNNLGKIEIGSRGSDLRLASAPIFLRKQTFVKN